MQPGCFSVVMQHFNIVHNRLCCILVMQLNKLLTHRFIIKIRVPNHPRYEIIPQFTKLAGSTIAVCLHEQSLDVVTPEIAYIRADTTQVGEGQVVGAEIGVVVPDPNIITDFPPIIHVLTECSIFRTVWVINWMQGATFDTAKLNLHIMPWPYGLRHLTGIPISQRSYFNVRMRLFNQFCDSVDKSELRTHWSAFTLVNLFAGITKAVFTRIRLTDTDIFDSRVFIDVTDSGFGGDLNDIRICHAQLRTTSTCVRMAFAINQSIILWMFLSVAAERHQPMK